MAKERRFSAKVTVTANITVSALYTDEDRVELLRDRANRAAKDFLSVALRNEVSGDCAWEGFAIASSEIRQLTLTDEGKADG